MKKIDMRGRGHVYAEGRVMAYLHTESGRPGRPVEWTEADLYESIGAALRQQEDLANAIENMRAALTALQFGVKGPRPVGGAPEADKPVEALKVWRLDAKEKANLDCPVCSAPAVAWGVEGLDGYVDACTNRTHARQLGREALAEQANERVVTCSFCGKLVAEPDSYRDEKDLGAVECPSCHAKHEAEDKRGAKDCNPS